MFRRHRRYTNVAALMGPAAGGGVTGWASLIPQSGLVAAWPFDSTYTTSTSVTDPIGGFNSTSVNAFSLNGSGPTGSPNLNNAGKLVGSSSSYVQTSLANIPGAACSVTMWLNTASPNAARQMANDNPGTTGFNIYNTSGVSVGAVFTNGTSTQTVNISSAGLSNNTWIMCTWTWDGTNITPYTNGSAGTTVGLTGTLANSSGHDIAFGFNPLYSGDYYTGLMAGAAVWNRALSSTEVSDVYSL
jgi:hypothetical protein